MDWSGRAPRWKRRGQSLRPVGTYGWHWTNGAITHMSTQNVEVPQHKRPRTTQPPCAKPSWRQWRTPGGGRTTPRPWRRPTCSISTPPRTRSLRLIYLINSMNTLVEDYMDLILDILAETFMMRRLWWPWAATSWTWKWPQRERS